MSRLYVGIQCMAYYSSAIEVPDGLSLEEAIEYAEQHIDEIPLSNMDWISGSDTLDKNNCEFAE